MSKRLDQPLEIGKTYMDTWGREHHIEGFVKGSKTMVWAHSGFWFSMKTGESQGSGHHLISLSHKRDEVRYWLARLKQIRSVNHADSLRLVKDSLDRMRARVNALLGRDFLSFEIDLTQSLPPLPPL